MVEITYLHMIELTQTVQNRMISTVLHWNFTLVAIFLKTSQLGEKLAIITFLFWVPDPRKPTGLFYKSIIQENVLFRIKPYDLIKF